MDGQARGLDLNEILSTKRQNRMEEPSREIGDTDTETLIRKAYTVKEYIGLAADEGYRLKRKQNRQPGHVHPLVDWGMTEADCLQYCYGHGYDWNGLYEQFRRVSCWCCPLQPLTELRELYYHHPDLWEKLKEWDKRTWRQFRADYSVEQLEVRFLFEEECLRTGKPVKGKRFFAELKERLAEKAK